MSARSSAPVETQASGNRRVVKTRAAFWMLIAALVAVAFVGAVREYRVRALSDSLVSGLPSQRTLAGGLAAMHLVSARFADMQRNGPRGEPAPWPFRTAADELLTGGDCGHAVVALGAVFYRHGWDFRIIQVDLRGLGPTHVMAEIRDDHDGWVLIDPLFGREFRNPRTGALLGIKQIRRLPPDDRAWLGQEYTSTWSLFRPYRRTNWSKVGPVAHVLRAVAGDCWMRATSLRAVLIEPGRWLIAVSVLGIVCAFAVRARRRRARARLLEIPKA